MEQKNILLSALSVGMGIGIGLASGQTVSRWTGSNSLSDGISGEKIENELMRQIVDGRECKVEDLNFKELATMTEGYSGSDLKEKKKKTAENKNADTKEEIGEVNEEKVISLKTPEHGRYEAG